MAHGPSWEIPARRVEAAFGDKKEAFDSGEARAEANRCLYCYDAPCIGACPTRIDIPSFIRKIATGNPRGAARTILSANLLGDSCSRVCPVEVLCEGSCVYMGWGRRPIEIGRLQRFAMEEARDPSLLIGAAPGAATPAHATAPHAATSPESAAGTAPGHGSIGLVGGGPASLACAGTLALLGHDPVIYEKGALPGGLNVTGVAPYKMRVEGALEEVEFIRSLGVTIETGVEIGADVTGAELLSRHDAVFLGPGLGEDSFRGVPGSEGSGVVGAVEWIESMKLGSSAGIEDVEHAVVVGGGNTALDVVQELAHLGVPEVVLVYRRSEEEMPGYRHEWRGARRLQVRLIAEAAVSAVGRDLEGNVEELGLVRAKAGRATEEALPTQPCDLLIVATGQERLHALAAQFEGVQCDDKGCFAADEATLATGNPRVFAGGDCRNGGKEVVNAADEGQRAAHAIHQLLIERHRENEGS